MPSNTSDMDASDAPSSVDLPADLPIAMQVKNLGFYYGDRKVIEGISIDFPKNHVTAIIGPSGCGKSTFIKSLNRIGELETQVRVEGSVQLFGQDIYGSRINLNRLRRQIGMVFQKPNPFGMSIFENVAYGARLAGINSYAKLDSIVESALKGSALWDEVKDNLKKSAFGLSGGQQQRLCIARALAVRPQVLLMDEPCSALDPIATMKIEELIQELRKELTIVIVTHNMQQASRISDYTAFFNADETRIGRLVEFGPTHKIFRSATDPRTRDYVEGRFG